MAKGNFGFLIAVLMALFAYDLFDARHLPREEWTATIRKSVISKLVLGAILAACLATYAVIFGVA